MAVEADGHQLRHGLPFGEPLFHEDLQLHPGGEGRHGGLDVLREQSVHRDVRARDIVFDVGLAVAQDLLLEEGRDLDDGHHLAFADEPFALPHRLHAVGDERRRRVVDHLHYLARERRVVLVEHGDRDVADRTLVEKQGEECKRDDGQQDRQHEVHRLAFGPAQLPLCGGAAVLQKPRHRYLAILSQSTRTLMPGRRFSTGAVGRALTANVRMSNPPCVRVAAHVAKSACGAM